MWSLEDCDDPGDDVEELHLAENWFNWIAEVFRYYQL